LVNFEVGVGNFVTHFGNLLRRLAFSVPGFANSLTHSGFRGDESGFAPARAGFAPARTGFARARSGFA
jgi:hypothetical protein